MPRDPGGGIPAIAKSQCARIDRAHLHGVWNVVIRGCGSQRPHRQRVHWARALSTASMPSEQQASCKWSDHWLARQGEDHDAHGLRNPLATPLIDRSATVGHGGHGAGVQSQAGGQGMTVNLSKHGLGTAAGAAGALMASSLVHMTLNCPLFWNPDRNCLLTICY